MGTNLLVYTLPVIMQHRMMMSNSQGVLRSALSSKDIAFCFDNDREENVQTQGWS